MIDLEGKVVLVTGGGSGLGADIAAVCAQLGARLALVDIDAVAASAQAGTIGAQAFAMAADISDETQVRAAVAAILDQFGRVDVLVNNAAYVDLAGDRDALSTLLPVWDRTIEVNLRGTLLATRAVLPAMLEGGGGSIVNMVSRQGIAPTKSGQRVAYGVSEAAIVMLTRHIAVAFGKQGVRCNAVAPGTIRSERMLAALSAERLAQSLANVLTPELGEPADVSALVAFLASNHSRYITGQTLQVDGGVLSCLHE